MKLRKSLFWIHLAAGSVAGVVIFIMSLTCVCLAFERQLTNWANRGYKSRPQSAEQKRLSAVIRGESFSSYNLGRRLRAWERFAHTGEAGGIFGQSIAATASAGAAVLVWTGLALALRRCNGWRKRLGLRALAQS
jgi:uncharacterized iron-regulated membrane protein